MLLQKGSVRGLSCGHRGRQAPLVVRASGLGNVPAQSAQPVPAVAEKPKLSRPAPAPAQPQAEPKAKQADWLRIMEAESSGSAVEAKVKEFNKGGLVVMVGNIRGFVPYNQVVSLRKGHSGDLSYLVGQTLKCKIISADVVGARKEVVLSERKAAQSEMMARIRLGTVLRGIVQTTEDYGAFIELSDYPGMIGLVHKTELSWDKFMTVDQVVKPGQQVQVKVVEVDAQRCRLGLSIKALQQDPLKMTIAQAEWKATAQVLPDFQAVIDRMAVQPGVQSVAIGRQAVEDNIVSQELGLYLVKDAASASDGLYTVVARLQSTMQEIFVSATTLGRDEFKAMLRRVVGSAASEP